MQDKSAYRNNNLMQISDNLQEYIKQMVEEVFLKDTDFKANNKWLKKFLEAENINFENYEKDFFNLFQQIKNYHQTQSSAILLIINSLADNCFIPDDLLQKILNKPKEEKRIKVEEGENPQLHIIVKIGLWIILIINSILAIGFIVLSLDRLMHIYSNIAIIAKIYAKQIFFPIIFTNIFILNILAAVWLLRKVKLGFWLTIVSLILAALSILGLLSNVFGYFEIDFKILYFLTACGILISNVFSYVFLPIRKNGISAWKALGKYNRINNKNFFIVFVTTLCVSILFSIVCIFLSYIQSNKI